MLIPTLREHSHLFPNDPAIVVDFHELTWQSLFRRVEGLVAELEQFSGKRVLLLMNKTSEEGFALLLASSGIPMEAIVISSFHSIERAEALLKELGGDFLVTSEEGKLQILAQNRPSKNRPAVASPFICLLTSGTTGIPKCVKHDWTRLASAAVIRDKFIGQRWLSAFHFTSFAGIQVVLQAFFNRGCLVVSNQLTPQGGVIEALEKYGVNYLNCTPTYIRQLIGLFKNESVLALSSITLGGEICDQLLIDQIKKRLPNVRVTHIYASTELGASIEVRDEREGFPAELIDGKRLKIEDGELYITPSRRSMIGYLDQDALLDGSRVSENSTQPKEETWVSTKDLVELRGDRVLFLGRRDHLINVAGFKVNAGVVEGVIRRVEGVSEVAVSAQKNPVSGNLVKAKIQLKEGADQDLTKKLILEACKLNLPYYAVPRIFEFVQELAHTATYKLVR